MLEGAPALVVAQAVLLLFPDPKFLSDSVFCDLWFELFSQYEACEAQVETSMRGDIFVEGFAEHAEWWQVSV